jgi:tetratricopeptide (TPR) repeat protein
VAEAAIGHYREALRLNADNPEAHFNLALALLRQNNRYEAVAHLTEALRLNSLHCHPWRTALRCVCVHLCGFLHTFGMR